MQFHEKLDFLMRLTNVSNSALSLQIKIDASHVSRLRRGQRSALKDIAIINSMATFFARHCKEEYQRRAIAEMLKLSTTMTDSTELSEYIARWLLEKKTKENTAVGNFIGGFSTDAFQATPHETKKQTYEPTEYPTSEISVYYGLDGKRQAALYFLSEVIAQKQPQTLLLFSDEATDWMTADPSFAARWASLMTKALSQGNRIKMIHTVSRDLDEMLNAIRQWMPLYMTGLIDPYFYPKTRDGIFKKTLFISPNISAVISNSIGKSIESAANMLIRNIDMIGAYAEEFNQYLSLCKPLMRIYTGKDKEAYYKTLIEYEKEKSNSLLKTESLSILTMPKSVIASIAARIGSDGFALGELLEQRKQILRRNIQSNFYMEIVRIFDGEEVKSGNIRVAFSEMLLGEVVYYTLEEYISHLEHLVFLLGKYDNFHIHLTKEEADDRYMIYAKEDLGAIVAKTATPPVVLAINESYLSSAFWGFLQSIIGEKSYQYPNNSESAQKLTHYIDQLKKALVK